MASRKSVLSPFWQSLSCAGLMCLVTSAAFASDDYVNIMVGNRQTVKLPDAAVSVSIDKRGILDVQKGDSKSELVISGRGQGSALIQVELANGSKAEYHVNVADQAMLRQALGQVQTISGLEGEIKGGRVVVGGKVRTQAGLDRLQAVKRHYSGIIVDAADRDIQSNNNIVATINSVLSENDMANISARAYGRILVLEGSPRDTAQRELALRIAKMVYSDIEDRMSKDSSGAPSLAIEVMFVEVQKKNDKEVGFGGGLGDDISSSPTGDDGEVLKRGTNHGISVGVGSGGGQLGRMLWQVGPLSSFLSLIQRKSGYRVMSNPKLIARSGEEAKFHSGGVFYMETSKTAGAGISMSNATPIEYGIKLGILPKIDSLGFIDSKIATSITDLGAKIADKESITTSNVDTAVTIRDGQSILLSGLLRKSDRKKIDRVPLLADVPLLGELFKSRRSQEEESELVIIVTMNRIQPSNERLDAADRLWQKSEDDVKFHAFD